LENNLYRFFLGIRGSTPAFREWTANRFSLPITNCREGTGGMM